MNDCIEMNVEISKQLLFVSQSQGELQTDCSKVNVEKAEDNEIFNKFLL